MAEAAPKALAAIKDIKCTDQNQADITDSTKIKVLLELWELLLSCLVLPMRATNYTDIFIWNSAHRKTMKDRFQSLFLFTWFSRQSDCRNGPSLKTLRYDQPRVVKPGAVSWCSHEGQQVTLLLGAQRQFSTKRTGARSKQTQCLQSHERNAAESDCGHSHG